MYGWIFGGTGEIALLWVREDQRKRGLGSQILAGAEAKARELGCRQMVIRTHSFQAPEFYRRHGYRQLLEVDGYPNGHTWLVFRKAL